MRAVRLLEHRRARADHGRDAERAGDDRGVRGRAARRGAEPEDASRIEPGGVRGREVVGDAGSRAGRAVRLRPARCRRGGAARAGRRRAGRRRAPPAARPCTGGGRPRAPRRPAPRPTPRRARRRSARRLRRPMSSSRSSAWWARKMAASALPARSATASWMSPSCSRAVSSACARSWRSAAGSL